MVKVFIGSTKEDLKAYRQAAIDLCKQQLVKVEPIAMEEFPAMDVTAVEGCLQKVGEADVYVGIFAHRYGFIPPNETRSITEMEYDEAGRLNLTRLCFFVDEEYPWNPKFIECKQQEKLQTLKQRISEKIWARFTTVEDFQTVFSRSLGNWLENYQKVAQGQLLKDDEVIESNLPIEPDLVIGRDDELEVIKDRLGLRSAPKQPLSIIRGWPGVGKTTLVQKIAHDPEIQAAFPDAILWVSVGQNPEIEDELIDLARLVGFLFKKHDGSKEDIRNAIRKKLANKRVLLIVDDVWYPDHGQWFQVVGAEGAIIYTTRLPLVADGLKQKASDRIELEPLTTAEGVELLKHPDMAPLFCEEYPDQVTKIVVGLEGLPLALRVAAGLLENRVRRYLPVDDLVEAIQTSAEKFLDTPVNDRFDPKTGTTQTVDLVFRQSTDLLDEEARIGLALLSILAPKPATFSFDDMAAIWQVENPRSVASRLMDWGLMEPTENKRFQIHSVVMSHAYRLAHEFGMDDDDEADDTDEPKDDDDTHDAEEADV